MQPDDTRNDDAPATPPYDRWQYEKAIRGARNLSATAKLVALTLATRARRRTGVWVMLIDTLAAETGLSRASVKRATLELETAGLLERVARSSKQGRRASGYRLGVSAKAHIEPLGKAHSEPLRVAHSEPLHQPLYQEAGRRGLTAVQRQAAQAAAIQVERERRGRRD